MTDVKPLSGFIGVKQTTFGDPDGNCFEACIASITKLPLGEIPHYLGNDWFEQYRDWLLERGWMLAFWSGDAPPGQCIASGPSPRGIPHSVVYQDGSMLHDPHPSNAGLEIASYFILLFPVMTMLNVARLSATIKADRETIRELTEERDRLADFKAYVHGRLDEAGIPVSPGGPHSDAGCRIGDRLDITLGSIRELKAALEEEQRKFQAETLRTSALTQLLVRAEAVLCPEHEPGAWSRSCERCSVVADSRKLRATPINAAALTSTEAP